jgi:hypothetical protein
MRRWLVVAGLVLFAAAVRHRIRGWGASRRERNASLPGDDLVPVRSQTTHGITLHASAAEVWPWLVQMGYGRGGWYSYDQLERRVGAGDFAEGGSATRVIPELQSLAVGDTVALSQRGGLTVALIESQKSLVLHFRMNLFTAAPAREGDRAVLDWTWAFLLHPLGDGSCRLLVRTRADFRPAALRVFSLLIDPVQFVMERKMLRSIERRVRHPAR